jgi:cell division protein FtsA
MHFGFIKEVMPKTEKLVVGLDVGTTKVCAVVGAVNPFKRSKGGRSSKGATSVEQFQNSFSCARIKNGGISIIGVGTASAKGIRKGVVTNIESITESIIKAVQEAETMAGVDIKAVHIGITGGHICCLSSHGVIAVKEKEIGQREVENVIDAAKAVSIPFDREMLHVIPVGFSVNGQNGVTDPRGMGGVRLETNVQIITGAVTSVQNLVKCCQKAGIEVIDVQPILRFFMKEISVILPCLLLVVITLQMMLP